MSELREYHRKLALACLSRASNPMTAAELAEYMSGAAQAEGHPKACWRAITGPMVAGVLRTLQAQGEVTCTPVFHTRHAREVSVWTVTTQSGDDRSFPLPPDDEMPEADPVKTPYDHLSREQLVALLEIHDDLGGLVAKFQQELSEFTAKARQRLALVGAPE